jgi:hypothetical protein
MLQGLHKLTDSLNQYANLLVAVATISLAVLTGVYVRLTSQTLMALKETGLREREALHLQEIKDNVIQPIIFWISRTVFERFTGKGPQLLTISGGFNGKARQFISTVDDPFTGRHRLTTPFDPDVPDPLAIWDSTESDRISKVLFDEAKGNHFSRELAEFDRLLEEVRHLTGRFIVLANESAKDIACQDIPQSPAFGSENARTEWTDPHGLVMDCIHSFLQGKENLSCELGTLPGFVLLGTSNNVPIGRAIQPDKLKQWGDTSLKHMRKLLEHSDLAERVRNLLEHANSVRQSMEQLRFTHGLGVNCELVSGKKHRR